MKKLDLFILKSFAGPFIMTFFITVFILVMQFLWLYIDDLVGKGLSFWVIMEFLAWGSATILPLSMPLSTLLASIMTFGNLGENNELLAMKAAGISLQRVFVPLIFVAMFISVAAFFVSNNLIPLAYNKIYTLQYDISKTKEEIKIPTGTFYNGIEGYSLRVDSRNKKTGMMYDVMVYNHTGNKGNVSLAIADSGMLKSTREMDALIFTLYNGVQYEETNKKSFKDTSYAVQQLEFSMQEVIIPLENYAFKKSESERYGSDVMSRNLKQLKHDRDSIGAQYDSTILVHEREVPYKIGLNKGEHLDTLKNRNLKNSFPLDSLEEWGDLYREREAVEKAIAAARKAVQTMQIYDREVLQHTHYLRRIDLESLRKYTLSFACFIFFFIGAPLGAIIRKGGLGTPVIVSALFFVLYWVVDISGKKLARDGAISPELGAFISTIVLLPIGVFLTWKSTKDSSIFNIETYLQPIKNFIARIGQFNDYRKNRKEKSVMKVEDKRCRIVFMGTPDFAVNSLKALIEGGYNVVGAVTVPDKKSGRGQKINCSAVKQYLLLLSEDGLTPAIPLLQPESMKDPQFLEDLRAFNADIFVVVAFRMLPKAVWAMPPKGTFNLHASLLPAYRGAAPINWAIINGEKVTGVTTFLLDEHIDTGEIIFTESVEIERQDNIGTLHDKLMEVGSRLVCKTVDALQSGNVQTQPQTQSIESVPEYARYAPKLTPATGKIDWNSSAEQIYNLVRGLSPRPGTHSTLCFDEQQLEMKIFAVDVVSPELSQEYMELPVGAVVTDGKSRMWVRAADQFVSILEIQAPGKKRLPIGGFLAGFRGEQCHFE